MGIFPPFAHQNLLALGVGNLLRIRFFRDSAPRLVKVKATIFAGSTPARPGRKPAGKWPLFASAGAGDDLQVTTPVGDHALLLWGRNENRWGHR
jgi:hypothetical protein